MLQWMIMAAMTALAALAVLAPLSRQPRGAEGAAGAIYRDQLRALARERAEGLVGEREAEAARIEIARRLLRSEAGESVETGSGRRSAVIGFIAAAILMPALALGVYLAVGSPALPDQPFVARSAEVQDTEIAGLIDRVEDHLKQAPQDGSGWELIAPVYAKLGRYDDAVRAYDNAIRILGPTADREALLGEAMSGAAGGVVTPEARAAFARALALDPRNERAAFYNALAVSQTGDRAAAAQAWRTLIAAAPVDAAWLPAAREELARVTAPGPDESDMNAAASKTPAERQAMIEGMVASLAARLDAAPDDTEGWARLFRAYMVLGRPADATAALGRAKAALAGKADLEAAVEKAAADSGVVGP